MHIRLFPHPLFLPRVHHGIRIVYHLTQIAAFNCHSDLFKRNTTLLNKLFVLSGSHLNVFGICVRWQTVCRLSSFV